MDETWTTELMEMALKIWNDKLTEVWSLLSLSPADFKDGMVWQVAVNIHNSLLAVGYGLLILFFSMSIFKSAMDFRELKTAGSGSALFYPLCGSKNGRNLWHGHHEYAVYHLQRYYANDGRRFR